MSCAPIEWAIYAHHVAVDAGMGTVDRMRALVCALIINSGGKWANASGRRIEAKNEVRRPWTNATDAVRRRKVIWVHEIPAIRVEFMTSPSSADSKQWPNSNGDGILQNKDLLMIVLYRTGNDGCVFFPARPPPSADGKWWKFMLKVHAT